MSKENGQFICGDALAELRKFPDTSVDMCLTSPPYWGLRDYGVEQICGGDPSCKHIWDKKIKKWHGDRGTGPHKEVFDDSFQVNGTRNDSCIYCGAWRGQLGLEPNPELYIEHLQEIFNEIKRVLKKEGTLWLNMGDTYWSAKGSCFNPGGGKNSLESTKKEKGAYPLERGNKSDVPNLPQKCLTMIPERLAWSLIQNGWILRNKCVWFKPNAMPSSVTDRFSNKWEYLFMFSKSQRYFFDLDAVREPHAYLEIEQRRSDFYEKVHYGGQQIDKRGKNRFNRKRSEDFNPLGRNPGDVFEINEELRKKTKGEIMHEYNPTYPAERSCGEHELGKNPGDVFEINTQPFPEAHFAVFPEKLCEKPIKAGCPEEVCKKCGKARERITERESGFDNNNNCLSCGESRGKHHQSEKSGLRFSGSMEKDGTIPCGFSKTIGWTSCKCDVGFEPGVVLDPFAGAGTVGVVAKSIGRRFILIDIKEEYIKMAKKRVVQVGHQKELFE